MILQTEWEKIKNIYFSRTSFVRCICFLVIWLITLLVKLDYFRKTLKDQYPYFLRSVPSPKNEIAEVYDKVSLLISKVLKMYNKKHWLLASGEPLHNGQLVKIYSFLFYSGFLSRTFTIHVTTREGGGYFFNSSLPLPPASQTLKR